MTQTNDCILTARNKTGCANCPSHCQHMIATAGRIKAANLPAEYRHLTLDNSPAREQQAPIYEKLAEYVTDFSGSLYLFSTATGTGKTTSAASLIGEYVIASYLGALKAGKQPPQQPAYFLDVNEWQTLYNGFNRKNVPQDIAERYSRPYYDMMERAKKAPFAALDDLGVRNASEAFRSDLHTVINYRVTNGLPTVYTSNIPMISKVKPDDRVEALKPYDLYDVFDVRLLDRIRDNCELLVFEGKSKRGRK